MPSIQVRDKATGQPVSIDLDSLQEALASGKYETTEASNVPTSVMGTKVNMDPLTAQGALSTGNVEAINPNIISSEQTHAKQREAFNDFEDKALTFAEGVTDALTFGLAHERGDEANLRREVNSGSEFAGQIAGIALGLKVTALGDIAELGENLGRGAAKSLLGSESNLAKIAGRSLGEAGANMTIAAAQATGHQVWDSLLENKPLAAEAIAHEVGFAGLLGAGFGLAGGLFSSATTIDKVESGSGLEDFHKDAASVFDSSINEVKHALRQHETRIGVLHEAVSEGLIPSEFMGARSNALIAAQKAEIALDKLGNSEYALNAGPKEAYKWQQVVEDFHGKVRSLDELMTPRASEMIKAPVREIGKPVQGPLLGDPDQMVEIGTTSEDAIAANKRFAESPELRAKYREIYGKEFEPIREAHKPGENAEPIVDSHAIKSEPEFFAGNKAGASDVTGVGKRPIDPDISTTGKAFLDKTIEIEKNPHLIESSRRIGDFTEVNIDRNPQLIESSHTPAGQELQDKLSNIDRNQADRTQINKPGPNYKENPYKSLDKFNNELDKFKSSEPTGEKPMGAETAIRKMGEIDRANKVDKHTKFRKLADEWFDESKRVFMGSPADRAINRINTMLKEFNAKTNGRLDAISGTGMARTAGMGQASTELGAKFQQAWALRKVANDAAKASRLSGSALKEPDALSRGLGYAKRRIAARIGSGIGGALIGHELAGDEGGYFVGAALATGYMGFGGRVAGTIGRISEAITKAGDVLLKGRRATVITQAVAKSRDWQYSKAGPIKDPIKRIQEIHHVAAHPEMIADQIKNNSGDLTTVHPELASELTKAAQRRMMALSVRAPKFMWDKWGQPINPPVGELRRFLEYENAVNDLEGTLKSISQGVVTKDQADGLRDGWPAFSGKLSMQLLNEPDKLKAMNTTELRAVEHITGYNLSGYLDGQFVARQQASWQLANETSAPQNKPIGKPQAFNIRKIPEATPTSTQSTNGRAPGN